MPIPGEVHLLRIKPGKPEAVVVAILCTITLIEFGILKLLGY